MAHGGSQARGQIGDVATTATATPDLSCVCDLHHNSQQRQILNPLSKARDWIRILMDTNRVPSPLSHEGNSPNYTLCCYTYWGNSEKKKSVSFLMSTQDNQHMQKPQYCNTNAETGTRSSKRQKLSFPFWNLNFLPYSLMYNHCLGYVCWTNKWVYNYRETQEEIGASGGFFVFVVVVVLRTKKLSS